jgi:hypothetical protein
MKYTSPTFLRPDPVALQFIPACMQWYQTDATGGDYFKRLIPDATAMQHTLPGPLVMCDSLGWNYFVIEVFDQGGFRYRSDPVLVYGDCEP